MLPDTTPPQLRRRKLAECGHSKSTRQHVTGSDTAFMLKVLAGRMKTGARCYPEHERTVPLTYVKSADARRYCLLDSIITRGLCDTLPRVPIWHLRKPHQF